MSPRCCTAAPCPAAAPVARASARTGPLREPVVVACKLVPGGKGEVVGNCYPGAAPVVPAWIDPLCGPELNCIALHYIRYKLLTPYLMGWGVDSTDMRWHKTSTPGGWGFFLPPQQGPSVTARVLVSGGWVRGSNRSRNQLTCTAVDKEGGGGQHIRV